MKSPPAGLRGGGAIGATPPGHHHLRGCGAIGGAIGGWVGVQGVKGVEQWLNSLKPLQGKGFGGAVQLFNQKQAKTNFLGIEWVGGY